VRKMAEQNRDKLHIRLHVYDEEIEVVIDRAEEEYYRAAAKHITDRYNVYSQIFKGRKSDHTIALMTLIIALQHQKERAKNDVAPYNDILNTLTAEIEDVLGEKKK
jgi:cell division protein ZapA